jgi:hypothetical protein
MATITHRGTSPKPPRFRKGARVAFIAGNGHTYTGEFIRAYTPSRNAGLHYEIMTDQYGMADLFANGEAGRTVTVQPKY